MSLWRSLVVLIPVHAVKEQINIIHFASISGSWPGGSAMNEGARLLAQRINDDPDILPNFELVIKPVDSAGSTTKAKEIMLGLLFDGVAEVCNYTNVFEWSCSKETLGSIGNPNWVGFLGASYSSTTMAITGFANMARKPLISAGARSSSLSDRTEHPYFWRTTNNIGIEMRRYAKIAKSLGIKKVAVMMTMSSMRSHFKEVYNGFLETPEVESVGPLLGPNPAVSGMEGIPANFATFVMEEETMLQATALAQQFMENYARIVFISAKPGGVRKFGCALYKKGVRGVIFVTSASYKSVYKAADSELAGEGTNCASQELVEFLQDIIFVGSLQVRPDRGVDPADAPCYREDPLTFWDTYVDAVTDKNGDHIGVNAITAAGDLAKGYVYGSPSADAVCMYALALHEMLEVRKKTLPEIKKMTADLYDDFQQVLGATEFEGLAGKIKFVHQGDPSGLPGPDSFGNQYIEQVRSMSVSDGVFTSEHVKIGTFRSGKDGDVVFDYHLGVEYKFKWGNETLKANGNTLTGTVKDFPACEKGSVFNFIKKVCSGCQAGEYFDDVVSVCRPCKAGNYQDEEDSSSCKACTAGRYQPSDGQTSCIDAGLGFMVKSPGQREQQPCSEGQYADKEGMSFCANCPRGRFAPLMYMPGCNACPAGRSTSANGARASSDCECDVGSYGNATCYACTQGMTCDEVGQLLPKQSAGFQLVREGVQEVYSAYRCLNILQCPQSTVPGSCAGGRTGLACGQCLQGHYPSGAGSCAKCGGVDVLPVLLVSLAVIPCVVALYIFARQDVSRTSFTVVTAALVLGQVAFGILNLGVFAQLQVHFPEPLNNILQLAQLFAFDLDVIKVQCFVQTDDPLAKLWTKLCLYPIGCAILALTMLAFKAVGKVGMDLNRYINSIGLLGFIINITLTLTVAQPFYCIGMPNGKRSMASEPSFICEASTNYISMAIPGALGIIIYPVGSLVLSLWITRQYPRLVRSGKARQLLQRYAFLFNRFRPECYYFGVVYLCRNIYIPLVPTIAPDSGFVQILLIAPVMLGSSLLVAKLSPWKVPIANITEIVVLSAMVMLIICTSMLLDASTDSVLSVLGIISTVLVCGVIGGAFVFFCFYTYRLLYRRKRYKVFLTHHKEGAAVLARFVKMKMEHCTTSEIFLDSDNLDELALICDVVRCSTEYLVVLLTRHTLERIWCAGEIATAFRNKIPIVLVACDDFVPLTEKWITEVGSLWSMQQKAALLETGGITTEMIQEAYRYLHTLPTMSLPRFADIPAQEVAIADIMKSCSITGTFSYLSSNNGQGAQVLVAGASGDPESRCTCAVLAEMIRVRLLVEISTVQDAASTAAHMKTVKYVVVVLTKGLLQDRSFMDVLLAIQDFEGVEIITAIADNKYEFPGPHFYDSLPDKEHLKNAIRKLHNILALPFTPHGSKTLMNTQVDELSKRFPKSEEMIRRASTQRISEKPIVYRYDL